jgi:hypothetical protein
MRCAGMVFLSVMCGGSSHDRASARPNALKAVEQAPAPRDVLEELVRTINHKHDKLHPEWTPSVVKLIEIGDPAIPRMLDLMLSDDGETRLRAQQVLERVTTRKLGFVPGKGWLESGGADKWRTLWKSLGNLDWEASREERERSVKLWREWLAASRARPR